MKSLIRSRISNFAIFVFITYSLIDANNIFLGIKSYIFGLTITVLCLSYKFHLPKRIYHFLLFIFCNSIFSYFAGRLYGYEVDDTFFLQFFLTFAILILLGWHRHLRVYEKLLIPCLILSVGTISLYVLIMRDPSLYDALSAFGTSDVGKETIYISDRTYFGYQFNGIFYTPLMICTIPAAVYLHRFMNLGGGRIKNLVLFLIFIIALFCAGNRAGLMSCLIIPVLSIIFKLRKHNKKLFKLFLFFATISIAILAYSLVNEKEEASNEVKKQHIDTYKKLLDENPIVYITGMGPGSYIYSKGFGEKTRLMEWTYIEMLRIYGFGGIIILIFFWFPVYYVYRNRCLYSEGLPFAIGSATFLLASATNPYLLNSTGMIFSVMTYSYMFNNKTTPFKRLDNNDKKIRYSVRNSTL